MTTASTAISAQQVPALTPASVRPGYISTVSLGSGQYRVYAYIENADGSRGYLPENCDRDVFAKIEGLAWGLLNSHDKKRNALHEAPYEITGIDSRGLIKRDNTVVSHDFLIQPYDQMLANAMSQSLTNSGMPVQPAAIKAQDVWNTFDIVLRAGINYPTLSTPVSNPAAPTAAGPTSPVPPPSSSTTTPIPPSNPPAANPGSTTADPTNPSNPSSTSTAPAAPQARITPPTGIDLDLRNVDLQQPDWYEHIPVRTKLRMINDIVEGRGPHDTVHGRIWLRFEQLQTPNTNALMLLERERRHLRRQCGSLPPRIPPNIRGRAEHIYGAYMDRYSNNREDSYFNSRIQSLMALDFNRKQQLLQRIREQAEAEGVAIENWDSQWAEHHFADSTPLFVHALSRWLDNDS